MSSAEPSWFTKVTNQRQCLADLWPLQGRMTWVWAGRRTASQLATPEPGLAAVSSLKLKNRTQYKNVSTSIFLYLTINIPEPPRGNRRQPQYLGKNKGTYTLPFRGNCVKRIFQLHKIKCKSCYILPISLLFNVRGFPYFY